MSSIIKVIELISESDTSWEEAARSAVQTASTTIRGIKSVYVQDMQATVKNGQIEKFRINLKISFQLES